MATDQNPSGEQAWARGWDGHLSEQRRRLAKLSLAEKLQWLEEAQRLAEYLQKDRGKTRPDAPDRLHDSEGSTDPS